MKEIKFPFDVEKLFKQFVDKQDFPRNDFKKQAILIKILDGFKDRVYDESEVNEIIKKHFHDYALIRRELINFGYMKRNSHTGKYKVKKRKLTEEDIKNNTMLRKAAEAYKI